MAVLMTLGDLRRRALATAGENEAYSFYGTVVTDWINDALRDMYTDTEGVEALWEETSVVGQREYPCPYGFLHPKQVMYNGYPLPENRLLFQDYFDTGTSTPAIYCIWGWPTPKLFLGPKPPADAQAIKVFYYRLPYAMTTNSQVPEIPEMFAPFLADYASGMIKTADNNTGVASVFFQKYQAGRTAFHRFMLDNGRSNWSSTLDEAGY